MASCSSSSSTVPTYWSWPPPPAFTHEQLEDLRFKIRLLFKEVASMGMGLQEIQDIESKLMEQINYVESTYKERQLTAAAAAANPHHTLELRSRLHNNIYETCEEEMPSYLLVSNGCMICLLDLKQSEDVYKPKQQHKRTRYFSPKQDLKGQHEAYNMPLINKHDIADVISPLPIAATLNLMEKQLPMSVGLFKLGSHAYMIGGQEFPPDIRVHPACAYGNGKPSTLDYYTALIARRISERKGINIGTSSAWYCLWVVDLYPSPERCNTIENMKRPKICPIVEEIDGEIHVFDSSPYNKNGYPHSDWVFSHEVLTRVRDGDFFCWDEIQTGGDLVDCFIKSHLVIGHCIYAVCMWNKKCLLFDSRKRKWEAHGLTCSLSPRSSLKTAWEIISYAKTARCVLDFEIEGNRFFIVIALGGIDDEGIATAFFMNSTGTVVCTQPLHFFFKSTSATTSLPHPVSVDSARILEVDKEGKTMCALVKGHGRVARRPIYSSCLFVTTFSVKMLPGAASRYGMEEGPSRGEFVHVDVKDRLSFDIGAADEDGVLTGFHNLQACFL